jgi:outer membrane murein-binding lipoprotein Lpp
MRNTRLFTFTVLVLIAFFTAGCVSQSKFDQITSELDLAQGQIQELTQANDTLKKDYASLKSEYDTLKTINVALMVEHETLQSDFAGTKADLEKTQTSLEDTKANLKDALNDVSALEEKMVKVKAKVEVLKSLFLPSLSGEYVNYSEGEALAWFLEWGTLVEATNDSSLQEKYDALVVGGFSEKGTSDFFIYLIEAISQDLE